MKRLLSGLGMFGLLFALMGVAHAGTPQETYYSGQSSLSNATIYGSTASTTNLGTYTLTIATPTAINSGGSTFNGRNCFTRFIVQIPTTTVVTIADNNTTVWTLYGLGLGASGVNTLSVNEDHLAPFCTAAGDRTVITLTTTNGAGGSIPNAFNYEGYTTYGGTLNAGPMY